MWAIHRRWKREHGVNLPEIEVEEPPSLSLLQHRAMYPELAITETPATDKIEAAFVPSNWAIALVTTTGVVHATVSAIMSEDDLGLVLNGDDHIVPCSVTLKGTRAMFRGKIVAMRDFNNPVAAQEYDVLKVQHHLNLDAQPVPDEEPKNIGLRRLQLMTSNSRYCKEGVFPVNEFALIDNGDLESLGKQLKARFVDWYPKAMLIKEDGSIETSYNLNSELFKSIQKKADARIHQARYGAEFVLQLDTDELVTMFCGSKAMRRQMASIKREENWMHTITAKCIHFKNIAFFTTEFTPDKRIPILWMGEQLCSLGNKRLWNIIQAVECGHWASGKPAMFRNDVRIALEKEYSKRQAAGDYTKKKIKKIKKKNKEYEVRFCTHGRDPNKTYPNSCPRCKQAKPEDRYVSRGSRLNY